MQKSYTNFNSNKETSGTFLFSSLSSTQLKEKKFVHSSNLTYCRGSCCVCNQNTCFMKQIFKTLYNKPTNNCPQPCSNLSISVQIHTKKEGGKTENV